MLIYSDYMLRLSYSIRLAFHFTNIYGLYGLIFPDMDDNNRYVGLWVGTFG